MAYDEEPEDERSDEVSEGDGTAIKVETSVTLTMASVLERIAEKALDGMRDRHGGDWLRKRISDLTAAVITKHATERVEAIVAAEVDRLVAEGWTEGADLYSQKAGQHVTIDLLVRRALTEEKDRTGDSYNRGKKMTLIDHALATAAGNKADQLIAEELKLAREAFKASVKKIIDDSVLAAARDALLGAKT